MNFHDFSAPDGSENDPKLAQDHSKTVPKAIIFHVDFLLQFWTVLGSVLAPFWDPFGLPNRPQIRGKNRSKLSCGNIPAQDRSKRPQERPKRPQDRPKRLPRPSQTASRGPNPPQEAPQEAPKTLPTVIFFKCAQK